MYGRGDDEWEAIVVDATMFLQDQGRLRRVTSYSEVNSALARRGHVPFDFSVETERSAIGAVLGQVTKRAIGDTGVMLSSIVAFVDRNDAGPGFYALAVDLGLLVNTATADDKLAFWSGQVGKVHDHYARPTRRRQRD
jgi:hypothetical protein